MQANKLETTPPSRPLVPEGFSVLLLIAGGIAAVWGAMSGLDPGFHRAGPLLDKLTTEPVGLWTIRFLYESISGVILSLLGEVVNKVTVIRGLAALIGYGLLPAKSRKDLVGG